MLWGATFLLGLYGAYFGAALGIMLLAVLGVLLPDDIQRSNALKGMLSLVMNAIAVVYFAFFGPVAWSLAAIMAVGAVAGGWSGVGVARRLGRTWLRRVVVGYGLVVAGVLLYRLVVDRMMASRADLDRFSGLPSQTVSEVADRHDRCRHSGRLPASLSGGGT